MLSSALAAVPSTRLTDRIFSPRLPDPAVAQRTSVVHVPSFCTDDEIAAIQKAAATVRESRGVVSRSNGLEAGSWQTVFFNHHLKELLPDFHSRLLKAARAADHAEHWAVLDTDREQLALRCAEYHTVSAAGGLPIEKHYDAGSLITMDLMLSHTNDFEGGVFSTLEADGTLQPHVFERGDLLVFLSHKYHCVSPVISGRRQVLVCELWEGLERRCPCRCNVPWGPCNCRLKMDNFIVRHDEQAYTDLATLPFSRTSPLFIKQGWATANALRMRVKKRSSSSS